jgi:formate-dependent phosphoribosylglycinamide formyltransferase (GAR transformylase)
LGGLFWSGIFLADDGVYFSELSPHIDTGMVTLEHKNEFELHRAILSLPILKLPWKAGQCAILASENIKPTYRTRTNAALPKTDFGSLILSEEEGADDKRYTKLLLKK